MHLQRHQSTSPVTLLTQKYLSVCLHAEAWPWQVALAQQAQRYDGPPHAHQQSHPPPCQLCLEHRTPAQGQHTAFPMQAHCTQQSMSHVQPYASSRESHEIASKPESALPLAVAKHVTPSSDQVTQALKGSHCIVCHLCGAEGNTALHRIPGQSIAHMLMTAYSTHAKAGREGHGE